MNETRLTSQKGTSDMKIGDTFIISITHYRKWWQFWKPRHWTTLETFEVVESKV